MRCSFLPYVSQHLRPAPGDVVGPVFPEVPVGAASLLGMEVISADGAAFDFAANLYSLHYLRLTNQIKPGLTYDVSSI